MRRPLRPLLEHETVPPGQAEASAREIYITTDPRCRDCGSTGGPLAIAGGGELDALAAAGPLDARVRAALAAGRIVVFDPDMLTADGRVHVELGWEEHADRPRTAALPAHLSERRLYWNLPAGLVPPSVAREQGWETAPSRVLVAYAARATRDQVDTAVASAERAGATPVIEEGPNAGRDAILLAIAAVAGFVTLVGVAISVSLSAAEGRADLATLAAVGAPPRRRRALVASQALLVGGLGCALGVSFGAFVAYTVRAATGAPGFVVPWGNLAVTALVVPLLAVLVATAFTPSRLPLVRRVT